MKKYGSMKLKEKNKEKEKDLNNLLSIDGHIKRNNIFDAEEILYNNNYKNIAYDKYGFTNNNNENENNKDDIKLLSKENERLKKWLEIIPYFENYRKKNKKKLKRKIRKGIPDSLRGEIWLKICDIEKLKKGKENYYNELTSKIKESELIKIPDEDTIIKDMYRTFPGNLMFMNKLGDGQRKLFRVLSCFSMSNQKVGYAQGMSFICALFLSYVSEENAFWMFNHYIKDYGLKEIYYPEFPGLKKHLFVLLKFMKKLLPDIYNQLKENEVFPTIYASSWYLTCFTNYFSYDIAVRIIDCFLFEGIKIIHRIALGILALNHDEIVNCKGVSDVMGAFKYMKDKISIEPLFKKSFSFSISKKKIIKYENLYNDYISGIKPEDDEFMKQVKL